MNLDKIREMSDAELRTFISTVAQRNNIFCAKCGGIVSSKDKKTINVSVYDEHNGQRSKKLCTLCNNCYVDILDYLGVSDIQW